MCVNEWVKEKTKKTRAACYTWGERGFCYVDG